MDYKNDKNHEAKSHKATAKRYKMKEGDSFYWLYKSLA
jgi:hypothetical protein